MRFIFLRTQQIGHKCNLPKASLSFCFFGTAGTKPRSTSWRRWSKGSCAGWRGNYLRHERLGHTLQPTALVNEAYLRLIDHKKAKWQNRAQFYGIAAQLMRRILVDHARQHKAAKRGGCGQQQLSITSAHRLSHKPDLDVLALHEALEELATVDPQQSRIVELKFFGGLSIEETAELLGVGHATVERDWKMARAWLRRKLD